MTRKLDGKILDAVNWLNERKAAIDPSGTTEIRKDGALDGLRLMVLGLDVSAEDLNLFADLCVQRLDEKLDAGIELDYAVKSIAQDVLLIGIWIGKEGGRG